MIILVLTAVGVIMTASFYFDIAYIDFFLYHFFKVTDIHVYLCALFLHAHISFVSRRVTF